ncbi:MAG TPA: transposase [Phototrophicaceae bacterium]|nr:transposase [Phototrophicaceae bacterium]
MSGADESAAAEGESRARDGAAAGGSRTARRARHVPDNRLFHAPRGRLRCQSPPETRSGKRRVAETPARKLLKRLDRDRHAVLHFSCNFAVPFDNNLAERDLRMMKVKQKVADCFRTLHGAVRFCTLRSYLSTARKHDLSMFSVLVDAFSGNPFTPALTHP